LFINICIVTPVSSFVSWIKYYMQISDLCNFKCILVSQNGTTWTEQLIMIALLDIQIYASTEDTNVVLKV